VFVLSVDQAEAVIAVPAVPPVTLVQPQELLYEPVFVAFCVQPEPLEEPL